MKEESRVGMPEIVEADARNLRSPDRRLEPLAHDVGIVRLAVRPAEDEIRVMVGVTLSLTLLLLDGSLSTQGPYRTGVDRDQPPSGSRLGWPRRQVRTGTHQLLTNGQSRPGKVDVMPAQTQQLATPHARLCCQPPERVVAVVLGGREEASQLILRPRQHLRRRGAVELVRSRRRIGADEPLVHGVGNGLPQRQVHVVDVLRRETTGGRRLRCGT